MEVWGGRNGDAGSDLIRQQKRAHNDHRNNEYGNEPTPEITRAAERYLEQYGDPLVMNTYLKVTILVLAAVCIALAALTFKSQQALANMHP